MGHPVVTIKGADQTSEKNILKSKCVKFSLNMLFHQSLAKFVLNVLAKLLLFFVFVLNVVLVNLSVFLHVNMFVNLFFSLSDLSITPVLWRVCPCCLQ